MRSKSEAIIANMLAAREIPFIYEAEFDDVDVDIGTSDSDSNSNLFLTTDTHDGRLDMVAVMNVLTLISAKL